MVRSIAFLVLSLTFCACASMPTHAPIKVADPRQDFLERFARGYYPGRSGQIFVVPREGDFITVKDPNYAFTHGSPWPYDSSIPILFYGPRFIRRGTFDAAVSQQDIAPTLAALLGTRLPSTITGHVQREVLAAGHAHPKVIALFVLDAMRADYFERFADALPTLTRLRREGAWFSRARINYLPTVTSVGHATIGTGTDPRFHGQASNNLFNVTTGKSQQAYLDLDPRELMALTLADVWNIETEGRAVIVGQGGAIRAVAGLVGHGGCIVGGKPVLLGSYKNDGTWETNSACYVLPEPLKTLTAKNPDLVKFRTSSLFPKFEGDALVSVIEHEPIGADDITDLLMVNMKAPDYTAHAHGPDSPDIRETLAELDRQIARVVEVLDRKAGAGQTVIAITADHGMASEPPQGHRRIYWNEVVEAIHQKFDPAEKKVVRYYEDPANQQIYLDRARLQSLGFSLKQVAQFLETLPFIQAAFTEDEVRAVSFRAE